MVKAGKIDGPGKAQQTDAPQQQQKTDAADKQRQARAAQDAARVASGAGFHGQAKKKKGLALGDSSQAPIPLPQDELEDEAWTQERLDSAQSNLTLAGAQLGAAAKDLEPDRPLAAAVLSGTFMSSEEELEALQKLAEREPPPRPDMTQVSESLSSLFGVELAEEIALGHKMLAAGLLVAGEAEAVAESINVGKGGIREEDLAGGVEKVTKRGNQAVGQAQMMSKGINRELNVQRTFVFKR